MVQLCGGTAAMIFVWCAAVLTWFAAASGEDHPETWIGLTDSTKCGHLLSSDADVNCKAICAEEQGYDSAVCYLSVIDNKASNCSIPWAYDKKEILSKMSTEDLADCQKACIDEKSANKPMCSAFEFHSDTKDCILRNRWQMNELIQRLNGKEECASTDFSCKRLFEDDCPTCFGRRVCMRRDENVFSAPRLCQEKDMVDRHRCISPGYSWPLTQLVIPRDFDYSMKQCADAVTADPEAAPPGSCYVPMVEQATSTNHVGRYWLAQFYMGGSGKERCAYEIYRKGANGSVEEADMSLSDCHAHCRKSDSCVWYQWSQKNVENFLTGSCSLYNADDYSHSEPWASPTIRSGGARCTLSTLSNNLNNVEKAKDPEYDSYQLSDTERKVDTLAVCDRLVALDDGEAASEACRAGCYKSSKYDTAKCAVAVTPEHKSLACVANVQGLSTAFLDRQAVTSLAQCSDLCSARADCAAWEATDPADGSAAQCTLKSIDNVYEDTTADAGTAGTGEKCWGAPSNLEAGTNVYRGARGCAFDLAGEKGSQCFVPLLPIAPHLVAIAKTSAATGVECAKTVLNDPQAAVPKECELPGRMVVADTPGTGGGITASFPADGCHQSWGYGPLSAAAHSGTSAGACQDLCRSISVCVYWIWEQQEGAAGDCYLKSSANIEAAIAEPCEEDLPEGAEVLQQAPNSCVYSHSKLVSAPRTCIGQRDPLNITDIIEAFGTVGGFTNADTGGTDMRVVIGAAVGGAAVGLAGLGYGAYWLAKRSKHGALTERSALDDEFAA